MGILKLIFGLLIVVVIVAIIYGNSIVGSAIEKAGSQALGTNVSVNFVSINPFIGTASISEISISNPDGYSEKNAVELRGFSAEVDIASLFSDLVQVKELRIDEPLILLEQKNAVSNLLALYNNVSSRRSPSGNGEFDGRQKKLVIDNLYINNASVRLVSPQFKSAVSKLSVKLPDIHLKDIGKGSNGATIGQVAKMVIKEISDGAKNIDLTQFGTGALRQVGGQLGIDAEQLIKGREAEVDQLRGLLNSR